MEVGAPVAVQVAASAVVAGYHELTVGQRGAASTVEGGEVGVGGQGQQRPRVDRPGHPLIEGGAVVPADPGDVVAVGGQVVDRRAVGALVGPDGGVQGDAVLEGQVGLDPLSRGLHVVGVDHDFGQVPAEGPVSASQVLDSRPIVTGPPAPWRNVSVMVEAEITDPSTGSSASWVPSRRRLRRLPKSTLDSTRVGLSPLVWTPPVMAENPVLQGDRV